MKERSFLDTNILIYTDDAAEPQKQTIAMRLFEAGWNSQNAVISTQVLQEYLLPPPANCMSRLPMHAAR